MQRSRRWWWRRRGILIARAVMLVAAGAFAVAWSQRGAEEASVEEAVHELDGTRGADGGFLRPAGGVYVYEGIGTEQLSLLATGQQWGPRLPASVVPAKYGGCWVFKIEYSTNHRQWTTSCPRGRVLEEEGGRTFHRYHGERMLAGDQTGREAVETWVPGA